VITASGLKVNGYLRKNGKTWEMLGNGGIFWENVDFMPMLPQFHIIVK
jgi:hypothetical protein